MEDYKKEFINFLLKPGALQVFEDSSKDRSLKSKRLSPWFVNIGDFNDGESSGALADFYADTIINSGIDVNILYGIPDKMVGFASPVAIAMARKGKNVGWCFSRKDEKTHGEATNLAPADRAKKLLVGRIPKEDQSICQIDDVFTAGDAKYLANKFLTSIGRFYLPSLVIGVDRQEVAIDSKDAIKEYEEKTKTKVFSIVNATEIYTFLKEQKLVSERSLERLSNYLRVYGTDSARKFIRENVGKLEQKIIQRDRSVIPACDVSTIEEFEELVKQTADVEGIGGYKVGFELGYGYGIPKVVDTARKHTDKPIIFDHQKAGTDIPDTGKNFARTMKKAGVENIILFPQAGPETQRAWIYHALDNGLSIIAGGPMTHAAYKQSEGGYLSDEGVFNMIRIAARAGISNFVAPGTKLDDFKKVIEIVKEEGIENPVFYAPGFVAQGGNITDAGKVAGNYWNAIVGTGIYAAKDMKAAAIELTSQL